MIRRYLGRSGIEVSALGLGCWAIGGPAVSGGKPIGWGEVFKLVGSGQTVIITTLLMLRLVAIRNQA